MSLTCIQRTGRLLLAGLLLVISLVLLAGPALAQQQDNPPKVDLFVGYQWLNPGGTVPLPFHSPVAPVGQNLPSIPQGVGTSLTYNFTNHLGLEGDYGGNFNKFANESTVSIGPRLMWRTEGVDFFVHSLLGLNRLTPKGLDSSNGIGAIFGGGMDLTIWRPISFRLFEADFVWARHNFARSAAPTFPDLRRPTLDGVRLRSGLVFNFGGAPPIPPAATCAVQQKEVMVGEPVTATVTTSNFNPKHTLTYDWSTNGGKVTGKDTTATIDTNGVSGGSYTVTAKVTDPKVKKNGEVSCNATFAVEGTAKESTHDVVQRQRFDRAGGHSCDHHLHLHQS